MPLLGAAMVACGTADTAPKGRPADTGGSGNASASGSGGSGNASASGSGGTPFDLACTAPKLGSPVLRLLTSGEFANTINDVFPAVAKVWTNSLPANTVSTYGFANDSSTVVGAQLAQALLDTATSVATALTGSALTSLLPCASSGADRACAETFVTQYGRRLFRRALSAAEHDRYLAFFDSALAKSDFNTALKWVIVALIQSPNAVYRSEIGTPNADGTRTLSATELATEFAYTFSGTTPTNELLTQAESGAPLDAGLAAQLLATDAGKLTLQQFFEAYTGYPQVASVERTNVANFAALRNDMVQETRAFINDVVLQNKGGLKELLTATTTNPSRSLATYYGFPAPASDYAAVTRSSGRGIGLLAQGSILASRALPTSSSPTRRGLLVYSRLLCEAKRTPPPDVPPPPPPVPGVVTTRQRYEEQHAASGACAFCHRLFDPIGFGFEQFDEGGAYRATDGALPINTVSNVPKPDATPLFQFQDQETLAAGLAEQETAYQCFAAYLATYAFGTADSCLGSSRVPEFKAGTLKITDYFAALAAEPHFAKRASQ
jgi:hypothetical protein